jgi:hypothetical protein
VWRVDRGCGDGGSVVGVVKVESVGTGDKGVGEEETRGGMGREVDVGKVDKPKSKEFVA